MTQINFVIDKQKLEARLSRVFNAPPERLFEAYTNPEQIPHWWGPRELTTVVDTLDLRVGGKWRFVQKDSNGEEYAFRGEYTEIDRPRRLTYTFEFEPMAGHVLTESVTFEPTAEGKTSVLSVATFANLEDLEGMAAANMEAGAREGYERLAELTEA